ncbi:MAG: tetratricopeptide repeat protein [Rhodospirillaceae bacterium]|jgi:adenylate cyclase|nr:tetratricopeptide repeat protein [Rhodospirillaceae bacterium]MBT5194048.1 tetratricopeptide repeat protein [Rhodospirillaceae bacterium]MBT5894549.1 tetratricopeptide repeat protein [Rhodospirillaceae bacterium]MBT6426222.1 tetratricopeptide repeat protein [Rhodospirillaceae bacterium]MBT7759242.1 tetratricopeptide repeat protein [Rhodospirillaceae bacterium]
MTEPVRKLAAILAADVVGYSRLMGEDQARTLDALRQLRRELFEPVVEEFRGNVVKRMGDGWIVEFASVSDAVDCAMRFQVGLVGHDIIRLRAGIHIGEVVFEDEDVFGEGVNVAARLEELAEPGELLISDTVHNSLDEKAAGQFGGGDSHELKNIVRPVQVWRWSSTGTQQAIPAETEMLALPDKPSIAVLPFDNMSGDPEQEYFSDGMTEDIITALSRLRWLFVIARNSTFAYKGKAVDIKQVGRELGVRYVLEGSIRKAGSRIRVTAQLIEAESGNHIWAERYDRELADIFDLQDELTEAISAQVDAELAGSERALAYKKPTTDLDTWELYQRGMWHFCKYTKDDFVEARRLLLLASERAPNFANAYAGLTVIGSSEITWGFRQDRARVLEQGLRHAEKAVALDERDGNNQFALGIACLVLGDGERAIPSLEKSVDLNPSSAASHYGLGMALYWFGRAEEALPRLTLAIRLSPHDPRLWLFHAIRSYAHIMLDEFDLAIVDAKAAIQSKRDIFGPHMALAAAYSLSGRHDEARTAYDRAHKLNPELSAADFASLMGTLHPPYLEIILDALHQAGMPEK